MKVGIDIQSTVGAYSGLGVYTRQVLETLAPGHDPARPCFRQNEEYHFFSMPAKPSWNTLDRLVWENHTLPQKALKAGVRLLHVPAFSPPVWRPGKIKIVTTVHDLIGMVFPNQLGCMSRVYWGRWLPQAVKRSDVLVADSQHTRDDLIRHLRVPAEKIKVIYLSGHEGFSSQPSKVKMNAVKDAFSLRGPYFLFVGTLEPRKNLERVLAAFAEFKASSARTAAYQLAVVGSKDFARGIFYKNLINRHPEILENVLFTGHVNHEQLNSLYSGATAFLYPSLYEGFGIPILEAMGSGTPVITSNTTSIPEVAGDAALLINPTQVSEIREAMLQVAEDERLRQTLIVKGLERTRLFSWKKTVDELLDVYRSLA